MSVSEYLGLFGDPCLNVVLRAEIWVLWEADIGWLALQFQPGWWLPR